MTEKLVTAKELSEILDLSVETIWRYTREKRIPYLEIGPRQYRYREKEVIKALGLQSRVQGKPTPYTTTKMTSQEFLQLPGEDGYTLQLIDGLLLRDPSPTYQHQRVSRRLQLILINYFTQEDRDGEVFNAPLDVYLDGYTVVQPDLFYLPGSRPAKSNPVDSFPELVIEIISPSTTKTDRIRKLNSYQKAGIKHYWLVDPLSHTFECLKLVKGNYIVLLSLAEGSLKHPDFPGLMIELEALFAMPEV